MKAFIEFSLAIARQINASINQIHERALRAVYNDETLPFEELLGRDQSETIHQ